MKHAIWLILTNWPPARRPAGGVAIDRYLLASIKELLLSINQSFVLVLTLSLIVGAGLGYFITDTVLSMIYKYYVDVSIIHALAAGLLVIIVAALTITTAALKPTSANPVNGLREE